MADETKQAPPKPPQPTAPERSKLPGEVIVEMWDTEVKNPDPQKKKPYKQARNRQVIFPPLAMHMRAHWSRGALTSSEMNGEQLEQIPAEIPGIRVAIDVSRHYVRVFDPLSLPENEELFKELAARMKLFDGSRIEPWSTIEHRDRSPTQMKTAIWWAARMVLTGSAQVVKGEMPTIRQIEALPGKIRIGFYDNNPKSIKFLEDMPREDYTEAQAAFLAATPEAS